MIDVVFLLIVFFLTTAQFARMTRADVDLPKEPGEQSPDAEEAGVIVNINRDGTIIIDDEETDLDGLRSIVQDEIAQQPDGRSDRVKMLIRADRNLPAERLNQVVAAMQELGVGLGRFATEIPD